MWPDVSGRWQWLILKSRALSDRTHRRVWSGVTGRVWSLETLSGTSLFLLHCWPNALKSRPISSPSRPVANPSSGNRRQRHLRVRSWTHQRLVKEAVCCYSSVHWPNVSGQEKGPRPVKLQGHKPLRNTTWLERNLFQMIFGLHLSYLVLSLTSVHHT
jgi:hypothetical protein